MEKTVKNAVATKKTGLFWKLNNDVMRKVYDGAFILGWLAIMPSGAFPQYIGIMSIILVLCIGVCFFDDNFYLFAALFMFCRFTMFIGDTPAYRIYSYLVVIKFLTEISKVKLRAEYFPPLFVFALHCIFAFAPLDGQVRLAMNTLVDVLLVYIISSRIVQNPKLARRFFIAFILGGLTSCVYGWTNAEVTVSKAIRGAGSNKITRGYGSLSDANLAGFFYACCIYTTLFVKGIPRWLKAVVALVFLYCLMQTTSISAMLLLCIMGCVAIILKFRARSFFILLFGFVGVAVLLMVLLSIPQFREIPVIQGYLIRINEKLGYVAMGRLDLLTTDRSALWNEALDMFSRKNLFGKLFGGSVITVMYIDYSLVSIAIHQSVIQCLVNFGILGTLFIYIPILLIVGWRIYRHFSKERNYEYEDVGILRIMFPLLFLAFGMSVDFFIDWACLMFYFI